MKYGKLHKIIREEINNAIKGDPADASTALTNTTYKKSIPMGDGEILMAIE